MATNDAMQITPEEYRRYVERLNSLPESQKNKSQCIGCKEWIRGKNGNHCRLEDNGHKWFYCTRGR